ncbi:MAG: fibronectin type III domain-containing protein [Flavobacterium sp.]|nr:MAG: fibronectin type III domain-containing protein [Flavobacterium sp.]
MNSFYFTVTNCYTCGKSNNTNNGLLGTGWFNRSITNCYAESSNNHFGWKDTHASSVLTEQWKSLTPNSPYINTTFTSNIYGSDSFTRTNTSNYIILPTSKSLTNYSLQSDISAVSINNATGAITIQPLEDGTYDISTFSFVANTPYYFGYQHSSFQFVQETSYKPPPDPSIELLQNKDSSSPGINLKWIYTSLQEIKEISLIYYQNSADTHIQYISIPSTCLKFNLSSSGFVSGQSYSFMLQIVDINNTTVYSNTLVVIAPYILLPPEIVSYIGFDESLQIHLQLTSNILSSSYDTVEFVLTSDDNMPFWIIKPFVPSGIYTLSKDDNSNLVNNTAYIIACMFQPSPSNPLYKSSSKMSNTISATPSNLPNEPRNVTSYSTGYSDRNITVSWLPPNDISEWSNTDYHVSVSLTSSQGDAISVVLYQGETSYEWTGLSAGKSYLTSVRYFNIYGAGLSVNSNSGYIIPTTVADMPILLSASEDNQQTTLQWIPPSYTGQTPIIGYRIYKDGVILSTVSASTTSYTATGLLNGYTYIFYITVINAIGESVPSTSLSACPYGTMTIVSVVVTDKTLTISLNPNGKPIQKVLLIALDQDPDDVVDGQFIVCIPEQEIPQSQTQIVTLTKTFSSFSSDISLCCVIAHNEHNSAFLIMK